MQNFTQGGSTQFVWVPGTNTAVTADDWTTIDGTFTLPADATAPKIYIGSGRPGRGLHVPRRRSATDDHDDDGEDPVDRARPTPARRARSSLHDDEFRGRP